MSGEPQQRALEQNVLASIRHHKVFVVMVIVVYAAVGVLVALMRPTQFVADAQIALEDPQRTVVTDSKPDRPESRYVADQLAFLNSVAVADRASAVTRRDNHPKDIPGAAFLRKASIKADADISNYVNIRFRAADAKTAVAGANAIVQAYRELIRAEVDKESAFALERLDTAIESAARAVADAPEGTAAQEDAAGLLAELRAQRARLQIESDLRGDGIALFSPATIGKKQGVPLMSALAVAIVLGGLMGIGAAYLLDSRKQSFTNTFEPQALLDAPVLAEIPDFKHEKLGSPLPVLNAPMSGAAEAFRFLASGIGMRPETFGRSLGSASLNGRGPVHGSVAFVASTSGDGTTTLVANTAVAASHHGYRVLAIDADLETRGLTKMLLGADAATEDAPEPATAADLGDLLRQGASAESIRQAIEATVPATPARLSDLLRRGTSTENVQHVLETGAGGTLSLLGPGTVGGRAGWRSRSGDDLPTAVDERIPAALNSILDLFDLVVIDAPPLLHVSYADTLLRSVGALVIVIPHKSGAPRLKSALERLDLLAVAPTGYVYNRAPARHRRWPVHDGASASAARARAKAEVA